VTVQESPLATHWKLPGVEVTRYVLIGEPPVLAGAFQETEAEPSPAAAAWTPVGLPGTVGAGVTAAEALDGEPVPTPLVALTVKVYGVPLVRPDTVHVSGPAVQGQV
jgi:hypothetical protein